MLGRDPSSSCRLTLILGLVAVGLVAGVAAAQGAGRRLPPSPVAVDADGRVIGPIFGLGVEVRVGDRLATVGIGRDQFTGGGASVVFESPDCSGPAYLRPPVLAGPSPLLEWVGVGPPSLLLAPAGPLESRTIRSSWAAKEAPTFCRTESATVSSVHPAETLMDLRVFRPPFRIE